MLVRVTGRRLEYRPIAGTRPRSADPEEDKRWEQELREDEKERAEHVMLVDLGRNDLGRVSEYGTVQVKDFMFVERYSHVMHLVSAIEGKLRPECHAIDAFAAAFPAGTLSGAPKCEQWRSSRSLSLFVVASTAARFYMPISLETSIPASRFEPCGCRADALIFKPAPASLPIQFPKRNTRSASIRPKRCSARSGWRGITSSSF